MKQCPACLTTYTDETLRFCLADGSVLTAPDDEQSTVLRAVPGMEAEETISMGKKTHVRVGIPVATSEAGGVQISPLPPVRTSSGLIFKIVGIVVALGILALLLMGAAGAFVYFSSGSLEYGTNRADSKQVTASPTPANDDRDDLRDQIANLQKQLNDQKKATTPSNSKITQPKQSTTTTTARANSPSDGFLALRSLPSSEIGDRIVKIPHGAIVSIGACGPVIKTASRSGRWCQASYNSYSGWVFDAFVDY